jgi:hypothetical protein
MGLLVARARPAYLSFYGAERLHGLGHEALICVLRHWHEHFGAEAVATTGTVLYLHVERPPTRIADAYRLARQHHRIGPDTFRRGEVSFRRHARVLLGRHDWLLQEDP